jgi:coenzyme Q-binding protein COQ10
MPQHLQKRLVPYTPEEMFDLVADIGSYPEFLPWCSATWVRPHGENTVLADMVIGYKLFRERFTTKDVFHRPDRIDITFHRGPFTHLTNYWAFHKADTGCEVEFFIDFEFRSKFMERMIGVFFNEAIRFMVSAFEKRARTIYGPRSRAA